MYNWLIWPTSMDNYLNTEKDIEDYLDKIEGENWSDITNGIVRLDVEKWSEEERAYFLELSKKEGFEAQICDAYPILPDNISIELKNDPRVKRFGGRLGPGRVHLFIYVPKDMDTEVLWKKFHERYPVKSDNY